jgi:hypothetical protein
LENLGRDGGYGGILGRPADQQDATGFKTLIAQSVEPAS